MKTRIRTSKDAETIIRSMKNSHGLTPNIICRYAIVLSLRSELPLNTNLDNNGIEFIRTTLTGSEDLLLRELIKNHHSTNLSDDEYMSTYLKAHIERGLLELQANTRLCGSFDKYLEELLANGGFI